MSDTREGAAVEGKVEPIEPHDAIDKSAGALQTPPNEPLEKLGTFGHWDFDNLKRKDRRHIGKLLGSLQMIELPQKFIELGTKALWQDFVKETNPRNRAMIHRSLMQAAKHNREVATLVAKMTGLLDPPEDTSPAPINVAGNATIAVQAPAAAQPEEMPLHERRRQLMRPSEFMKGLLEDPEAVEVARELAERRANERESASNRE